MGARRSQHSPQYVRRDSHPRNHFGRVACCCYTTDASEPDRATSGSGGNRTHVILLKRQALEPTSGTLPLNSTSRWRRNRTPQDVSRRFWRPSAFPDAITTCIANRSSTPCGSRTRPKRLERPPTSPEVERGTVPHRQNANRPGVASTPGRRGCHHWLARGLSTRIQTQARTIFAQTQQLGREIDRLRGDRRGRVMKFRARVPEGHGGIGCKLLTVLCSAVGSY